MVWAVHLSATPQSASEVATVQASPTFAGGTPTPLAQASLEAFRANSIKLFPLSASVHLPTAPQSASEVTTVQDFPTFVAGELVESQTLFPVAPEVKLFPKIVILSSLGSFGEASLIQRIIFTPISLPSILLFANIKSWGFVTTTLVVPTVPTMLVWAQRALMGITSEEPGKSRSVQT
jgi:hypothetical protein